MRFEFRSNIEQIRVRPFTFALTIGILFRLAVLAYSVNIPILNEDGQRVSPLTTQMGLDFQFYGDSARKYFGDFEGRIIESHRAFFNDPFAVSTNQIVAGPVFPFMIHAADYRDGNTLPLALIFLGFGITLLAIWLSWLAANGAGLLSLTIFALLPNPVWLTLNISSDLPFAVATAIFLMSYLSSKHGWGYTVLWITALVALILTRAAGYAILLFVLLDILFLRERAIKERLILVAFVGALAAIVGVAYLPAFTTELLRNTTHFTSGEFESPYTFFGFTAVQYLEGIYATLPKFLDWPLSWLSLVGAKTLYFVGLRPSYSDIHWLTIAVRGAAGLFLLPGLVYVFVFGSNQFRLLVGLFILPVFLSGTQDRYNLAIQPLLFYFGLRAYHASWEFIRHKRPVGMRNRGTID